MCKEFWPDVFVKGKLDEATSKVAEFASSASPECLFAAYGWFIATQERANYSEVWLKYSSEQAHATNRRHDEIRREIAG